MTKQKLKKEVKHHLILEEISKGTSFKDIISKFSDLWGVSRATVRGTLNEAIDYIRSDQTKENLISMNIQRLDALIQDSMNDGDRKNAIKSIDTQNKMLGAYEEKVKLESDGEINFQFQIG